MSFIALAMAFPKFDPNALGGWGSFAVGAVAVLTLLGGWYGTKVILTYLRPRVAFERDRAQMARERDQAISEASFTRKEAAAARAEATSWRSVCDELKQRIDDIEDRVIPRFMAALKFIKALLDYIGHLEDAMSSAKVQFPATMSMPRIPSELLDDIPTS